MFPGSAMMRSLLQRVKKLSVFNRELKKKIHKQVIFQDASQVQWKRMLAVLRRPHLIAKAISEVSPQRDRWSFG